MEINKLHEHDMNQFNIDNTKTKSLDVDNLKTDNFNYDEESYCDIRDYSKVNRRIVKATKVVGIALTITAAALLTGTVISNVFLGKLPKLDNLEYVVEGNTVNYEFDIVNKGRMYVTLEVYDEDKNNVFTLDVTEENSYQGTVDELLYDTNYVFKIVSTNKFDYKKNLDEQIIRTGSVD